MYHSTRDLLVQDHAIFLTISEITFLLLDSGKPEVAGVQWDANDREG